MSFKSISDRLIERWGNTPDLQTGVPYRRMATEAEEIAYVVIGDNMRDVGYPELMARTITHEIREHGTRAIRNDVVQQALRGIETSVANIQLAHRHQPHSGSLCSCEDHLKQIQLHTGTLRSLLEEDVARCDCCGELDDEPCPCNMGNCPKCCTPIEKEKTY